MITPLLLLAIAGFVLGVAFTATLVRLGHRVGAMDSAGSAGHVKAELRPIPNIGGIAIAAAVLLPLGLGLAAFHLLGPDRWLELVPALRGPEDDPRVLVDRIAASTPVALALLLCTLGLHVMGVVDDRRPLPAIPKLAVQLAAALVMVLFFDVRLLTLLGPAGSIAVSVVWIIVITNAINFLDNMDGLAGGIGCVASLILAVAAILAAQWFVAGVLLLLAGGLAGFLVFNAPPARIFMGDGGSMVVGFLLAVLTARITFVHPALGGAWYGVFLPLAVLAVPLYDCTVVTVIRLRQGRSPLVGDQQHFSHRLVDRGLSRRGAVAVIVGLTAVTGIGGLSLGSLAPWQAILVGVQTLLVLGVVGLLEHASRRSGRRSEPGAESGDGR
jgi:UDP-GlcNAc:undecaprenyl-phosphate GlcNAc-1-phosphate transferase